MDTTERNAQIAKEAASGKKKTAAPAGGMRLQTFCLMSIAAALLVACLLVISVFQIENGYHRMQEDTQSYISLERSAYDMMIASDYLTEQVRAFAATGSRQFLDNYFTEVNETQRRDKALSVIRQSMDGTHAYHYLNTALQESSRLEQIEYYSMCLTIRANGGDPEQYPDSVRKVRLSDSDQSLSAREQLSKAQEMLYDRSYQAAKDSIRTNVSSCTTTLIDLAQKEQTASSGNLLSMIRWQFVLIVLSLLLVVGIAGFIMLKVAVPLRQVVVHIRERQLLPVSGTMEMQFLQKTYNDIFEETRREQDLLSYEASHDNLTGLYNRKIFEKERVDLRHEDIAMLLLDIDYFKSINDSWGHEIGDRILKKVAGILEKSFRSEDYVCRIGGDEFAVIMRHVTPDLKELIRGKMTRANEALQHPADDLPPASLSIGIAFSQAQNPAKDLYKDADTALYRVKEAGRRGLAFYDERA